MTEPTPPARHASLDAGPAPAIDAGAVIAAIGGITIALSSWLVWISGVDGNPTESAYSGPAWFLIDHRASRAGLSLGILVVAVGILVIVGAVTRGLGIVSLIGGLLALLVVLFFTYQVNRAVNDFNEIAGVDVSLTDFVGFGVFVALVGAILAIIGGYLSLQRG
ncbi:MAG: hypothetical protein ACRDY4_10845 [Acidimicrobiia bacterium]